MSFVHDLVQRTPLLVLFVAIALGYFVGKLKIGPVPLGTPTGCILVALVLGLLRPVIDSTVQTLALALFMYSIGFKAGPQFFGSLRRRSLGQVALSLVVAGTGLAVALGLAAFLKLDRGTAAGMTAGALTQSSVIGAAVDSFDRMGLSAGELAELRSNTAVSYAVTYVFGVFGVLFFLKNVAPRLMHVTLPAEAAKVDRALNGGARPRCAGELFAYEPRITRFYEVGPDAAGKSVGEIEDLLGGHGLVTRIRRGGEQLDLRPKTIVSKGDQLGIVGNDVRAIERLMGPEAIEAAAADAVGAHSQVVVTRKALAGRTLGEVMRAHGAELFVDGVERMGHSLTAQRDLRLERGDVLGVSGGRARVEAFAKAVGAASTTSRATGLVVTAIGLALGIFIGSITVSVGGRSLALGTGLGTLFTGLALGWLRSVRPSFARVPAATQDVMSDFGLAAFTAMIGLAAGPAALEALRANGLQVLLAGAVVTIVPQLVGFVFGRYVLQMPPITLLGALAGAESVTPAIDALTEESKSTAPLMGFTPTYAISSVLITLWGVVVAFAV